MTMKMNREKNSKAFIDNWKQELLERVLIDFNELIDEWIFQFCKVDCKSK